MNILQSEYTGAIQPYPLSAKFTHAGEESWVSFEHLKLAVQNTSDAPQHVWDAYLDVLNIFG